MALGLCYVFCKDSATTNTSRSHHVIARLQSLAGLTLTGAPEHGEQLAYRLARHERAQEEHRLGDALEIGVEI